MERSHSVGEESCKMSGFRNKKRGFPFEQLREILQRFFNSIIYCHHGAPRARRPNDEPERADDVTFWRRQHFGEGSC
jgi:hypothetical protein